MQGSVHVLGVLPHVQHHPLVDGRHEFRPLVGRTGEHRAVRGQSTTGLVQHFFLLAVVIRDADVKTNTYLNITDIRKPRETPTAAATENRDYSRNNDDDDYSLVRVRREVIVELERLRGRAGRLVGHAGVQQERRRVLQRTRFAVGQTGSVRVVPVEALEFHRCQLEKKNKNNAIIRGSTTTAKEGERGPEREKHELGQKKRCLPNCRSDNSKYNIKKKNCRSDNNSALRTCVIGAKSVENKTLYTHSNSNGTRQLRSFVEPSRGGFLRVLNIVSFYY